MADGGDCLNPGSGARPSANADRERFLTFALTAAEMLLEVSPEGRIEFAAGAFRSRLGEPPEAWLGRKAERMVAVPDRAAFDGAFTTLLHRDRLPPTAFRLPDSAGTPVSLAGLRLPTPRDAAKRFCMTVSSLPAHPAPPRPVLEGGQAVRAAARRLDDGGADTLSFIEVAGPGGMPPQPGPTAALVGEAITAGLGVRGVAGELAAGRFGIVSDAAAALDLAGLGAQIRDRVKEAGLDATVDARSVPLRADGLSRAQKANALRFAFDAFARGGHRAVEDAGFATGLAGFVERAASRADALRLAIAARRFRLTFQPVVGLGDGVVDHYEALLRPEREVEAEFGPAGEFVLLAETMGMAEDLDWAVVEAASSAARRSRGTRIAVNLSGLSLQSPAFRDRFLGLVDREPMLASRLRAEVTAAAEIEKEAEAARTVSALRERGIGICADGFGPGTAAFRHLRAFPVDSVKIGSGRLRDAVRSEQDRGDLASMVARVREAGARIVAERIETEADAALARGIGADFGQGWFYGQPGTLP